MTRAMTPREIKTGKHVLADKPGEGTILRGFYDRLRDGETVRFGGKYRHYLAQLRNFYEMELEHVHGGMRLKGEWYGPYFMTLDEILMEDVNDAKSS